MLVFTPANLYSIDAPCPGGDFEYEVAGVEIKTAASRSEKPHFLRKASNCELHMLQIARLYKIVFAPPEKKILAKGSIIKMVLGEV